MAKCSTKPDFKLLEFTENPDRRNIYDLQKTTLIFDKFTYFRREEPILPYLIKQGVKYVCESWNSGIKTLHTGLISTGVPGYYFGDFSETIKGAKKTSLMIFQFVPGTSTVQIYFFNHFNKRSIRMKKDFCKSFLLNRIH